MPNTPFNGRGLLLAALITLAALQMLVTADSFAGTGGDRCHRDRGDLSYDNRRMHPPRHGGKPPI